MRCMWKVNIHIIHSKIFAKMTDFNATSSSRRESQRNGFLKTGEEDFISCSSLKNNGKIRSEEGE